MIQMNNLNISLRWLKRKIINHHDIFETIKSTLLPLSIGYLAA